MQGHTNAHTRSGTYHGPPDAGERAQAHPSTVCTHTLNTQEGGHLVPCALLVWPPGLANARPCRLWPSGVPSLTVISKDSE